MRRLQRAGVITEVGVSHYPRTLGKPKGATPAVILRTFREMFALRWTLGGEHPREETTVLGEPRGPKTELRLSPEETIESVTPAGLKLAQLVEAPPYHYGAIFERSPR